METSSNSTDDTQEQINNARELGVIGVEITITKNPLQYTEKKYDKIIVIANKLEDDFLSFQIDADSSLSSKSLIFTLSDDFLDNNKYISIEYDGESLKLADNLADILDPNDDGSRAEYYTIKNQFLITIPHFSEHTITIRLTEALSHTFMILLYIGFAVLIGIFLACPALLSAAYHTYFKKKKP